MSETTAAPFTIRPAEPRDLDTLVRFNRALAREVVGRELDPEPLRRGVAACLGERPPARYLVAELDATGELVGQLMTFSEWSDWRCAWFVRIESVYVAESHRRAGVYRALHAHVVRAARDDDSVCGVRICVHRDNTAARATYLSLGLQPTHDEMLELPLRSTPR